MSHAHEWVMPISHVNQWVMPMSNINVTSMIDFIGFYYWKQSFWNPACGSIGSNPYWFELTGFRPESNQGPADNPNLISPALFFIELWWPMHHWRSFRTLNLVCACKIYLCSLSLQESHTCTLSRILSLFLSYSHTHSLSCACVLSLLLSLSQPHTHSNTHTHTHTHACTYERIDQCISLHIYVITCHTLQHITTHSNVLQHTASHCNAVQLTEYTMYQILEKVRRTSTHCNTLQHTATHPMSHVPYSL